MRKAKHIILTVVLLFVIGNVYSQTGYSNSGNTNIRNNGFQFIDSDFFNLEQGHFTVDGTLWLNGNITNYGIIDFSESANGTRSVKLEGEEPQIISGDGYTNFYNILFNNNNVYGFTLKKNITITHEADFTKGIIEIPSEEDRVIFLNQATSRNASSESYINGTVQKTGNTGFVFPIGDKGFYRFAAISAPTNENDQFSAKYTNENPANKGLGINLHDTEIINISDSEFWEINNEVGNSNPDITLSWDVNSTSHFIPEHPELIRIVRWDGTKWVNEGNKSWQGTTIKGAVTSSVSGYGFFTLASVENNAPIAIADTFFTIYTSPVQGNLLINDSDPDEHSLYAIAETIADPDWGILEIKENGDFIFTPSGVNFGSIVFDYTVCDDFFSPACAEGNLVLYIDQNADGDNIPDFLDIDDDNDGITDVQEGNGEVDTDADGIPDNLDTDSDNDGVPDIIEGHILLVGNTISLIFPTGNDTDHDGLDDSFDPDSGGQVAPLADHDSDSVPDWRDDDDDDDQIVTNTEITNFLNNPLALDTDSDGIPDYLDPDSPVLDTNDDFDFTLSGVPVTVNPLENDSPDFLASSLIITGMPGSGIVINNKDGSITYTPDINFTGFETFEYEVCTESGVCVTARIKIEVIEKLFIPEIITPNGDGKNDRFVINGIDRFEGNQLIIFNRWGDKVFESKNYKNDWSGENNQKSLITNGKLPVGTYYFILIYGDKEPLTGFVYLEW